MKINTPKTNKPKRKISLGGWVLIFSLAVVFVFGSIFALIMFNALSETGKTVEGNRFQLELNPRIETAKVTEIKTAIDAQISTVKSSINLKSATLRIMVQLKPELTDEELQAAILSIKDLINASLPIATYFTSTPDIKMYDLEIHFYNSLETVSTETFTYHYFILSKNAMMLDWKIQEVSTPVNPELAAELKAILEEKSNQ
ncbi:MAG: hypothetical protein HGB31_06005 [Erysipelotrichaceae bacterium]|nr:hypothetical protein [Erysipelotrichaceae bacterium]